MDVYELSYDYPESRPPTIDDGLWSAVKSVKAKFVQLKN
jgi:hypothetical protein